MLLLRCITNNSDWSLEVCRLPTYFCTENTLTIMLWLFSDTSQGGYTFHCSATLPDLTFCINDYLAVVAGEYINYSPAGSSCFWCHPIQFWDWYITLWRRLLQNQFDSSCTPRLDFVGNIGCLASHLQSTVNQFSMCASLIFIFGISCSWTFIVLKLYQLSKRVLGTHEW